METFMDSLLESIVGRGPSERHHRARIEKQIAESQRRLQQETADIQPTPLRQEENEIIKAENCSSAPEPLKTSPIRTCSTFRRPPPPQIFPRKAGRPRSEFVPASPTAPSGDFDITAMTLTEEQKSRIYDDSQKWDPRSGDPPPLGSMKGLGVYRRSTHCDSLSELERFEPMFKPLNWSVGDLANEDVLGLLPETKERLNFSASSASPASSRSDYVATSVYDDSGEVTFSEQRGFPSSNSSSRASSRVSSFSSLSQLRKKPSQIPGGLADTEPSSSPFMMSPLKASPQSGIGSLFSTNERLAFKPTSAKPSPLSYCTKSPGSEAIEDGSYENDLVDMQLQQQAYRLRRLQSRTVTADQLHEPASAIGRTGTIVRRSKRPTLKQESMDSDGIFSAQDMQDEPSGDQGSISNSSDEMLFIKEIQDPVPTGHAFESEAAYSTVESLGYDSQGRTLNNNSSSSCKICERSIKLACHDNCHEISESESLRMQRPRACTAIHVPGRGLSPNRKEVEHGKSDILDGTLVEHGEQLGTLIM